MLRVDSTSAPLGVYATQRRETNVSIKMAMELVFSARENGGGTFDREGNVVEGEGYVVGGKCDSLEFRDVGSIISLVEYVDAWLDRNESSFYGSWVDDGLVYIDAVDVISSYAQAVELGKERNQIAIWDLLAGEEVRLDRSPGDGATVS
jgi:hypothetical protein